VLAGYDDKDGVALYYLDYMAALAKVNFGAHGYCANFILSVFDREWKEGLSLEEGKDVARKCIHELRTRFMISQPNWIIKVVDKNGTRVEQL
jgi:20S proteasome alpha/beta subunit